MKTFIIVLLAFLISYMFSCIDNRPPATVLKVEYLKLQDSIQQLNDQRQESINTIAILQDSITELKDRPLMTSEQFLLLYKYDRLYKYYRICKKNESQWKYYKGWSIRVFEQ